MSNMNEQTRFQMHSDEVQELQIINIFTGEEALEIIKKRTKFECKIDASTRKLKYITDYITYETKLLKTIAKRRKRKRLYEKNECIKQKIIERIRSLYETVLQKFSFDLNLFCCFLKFCKFIKYNDAIDLVDNVLKKNSKTPEIFYIAAKWHAKDHHNLSMASLVLTRGVTIYPDNQLLYKELIEVELLNCVSKSEDLHISCLYKLDKLLNIIFKNVSDCEFYIEVLTNLQKYEFTVKIQKLIVDFLLKHYSHNENVWHVLAQRERTDLYHLPISEFNKNVEGANLNDDVHEAATNKTRTPKARLEACFAKYREGLSIVDASNKPKLWVLFVDFLLELQVTPGAGTVLKMETLKTALKDASEENGLLEEHYLTWIKLANEEDALEIAEKGTVAIPSSVDIWEKRLHFEVIVNDSSRVNRVFKLGVEALKEDSLPLWLSVLQYHYFESSDELVELIYKDSIKQPEDISAVLKPQYLNWVVLSKGIKAGRKLYLELAKDKPYCIGLHEKMSALESLQLDGDYVAWEKVHILATQQFGESDEDVWMNYILFYLSVCKTCPNVQEHVERICKRAQEKLHRKRIDIFIHKYEQISAV